MVWENVPGAFSSNKGEDFRAVLEEICRVADSNADVPQPPNGKWANAGCIVGDGWSVAWRVHDAQFWGVPQRRRRIALVADFGGQSAPEILFERKGVSGDIAESGAARERATGDVENCAYPSIARSLTARNDGSPCIDRGPDVVMQLFEPKSALEENWGEANVKNALRAGASKSSHAVVQETLCFNEAQITSPTNGNNPQWNEPCHTISATDNRAPTVIIKKPPRKYMTVRRLTPLECERLQGYPDGWTDIGDWTDSKGKVHKPSDSARYKALGNSIALPFWFWMLKRMSAYLPDGATLGSLFDGIGGFPLCWEHIQGKDTARWASEIEPFPIAVTKMRFKEVSV
jgi:site-specific DNA-cytosine methylase